MRWRMLPALDLDSGTVANTRYLRLGAATGTPGCYVMRTLLVRPPSFLLIVDWSAEPATVRAGTSA